MFIVYIIQNSFSNEIYIGFTKNLQNRLKSHNSNNNIATKRKNGEWILIYAEAFRAERDDRVRENKLKHNGNAKHGLIKRLENSLIENKK